MEGYPSSIPSRSDVEKKGMSESRSSGSRLVRSQSKRVVDDDNMSVTSRVTRKKPVAASSSGSKSTVAPAPPSVGGTANDEAAIENVTGIQRGEMQKLKIRCGEIENERDALVFQMRELELDHTRQLERLKKSLADASSKREAMQERIDRVEKLETSIIYLYVEVKDRSHENLNEAPDFAAEAEQMKGTNPLLVLDMLRASIRNLLAFKDTFENELKNEFHRKKTKLEIQNEQLEGKISDMMEERENDLKALEAAEGRMGNAEATKEAVIGEANRVIEDVKVDNMKLVNLIKRKDEELDDLRVQLEQREQVIRHKDIKLMRIAQLETQIQQNKMQHQFDLQKLQAKHMKIMKQFQKELGRFGKTEADHSHLQTELKAKETELSSYKKNIQLLQAADLQTKISKMNSIILKKDQTLDATEKKLRHAEYDAETLRKQNKQMQVEYDKLFNAVKKQKEQARLEEERQRSSIDVHKKVDEIPSHVDYYKRMVHEKDKELGVMADRVRSLMLAEHKHKVKEKTLEAERARTESELAELRMKVIHLERKMGGDEESVKAPAWRSNKPPKSQPVRKVMEEPEYTEEEEQEMEQLRGRNRELENTLKQFENLKTISQTTAEAYENLLRSSTPGDGMDDSSFNDGDISLNMTQVSGGRPGTAQSNASSRPYSAASNRTGVSSGNSRPTSAKSLAMSSNGNSTVQVGSLLRPTSAKK